MKKFPGNLSGQELINHLKAFGYIPTRQVGSHIRLTTEKNGTHHITIPNHSPIKVGTLFNVIKDIANHFQNSKEELMDQLF